MEVKVARTIAMVGRYALIVRSEEPVAKALVWEGSLWMDGESVARRKMVAPMAKTRTEKAETTATFLARESWR